GEAGTGARGGASAQRGFRGGDRVYGFQSHLDFTEPIIARLLSEPQSQQYVVEAGVDPKQVLAETAPRVAALADVAQDVFGRYFQQCGLWRRGGGRGPDSHPRGEPPPPCRAARAPARPRAAAGGARRTPS